MIARPTALGTDVKITDLETADQVLHELAWIQQRFAVTDAEVRAKINAITTAANDAAVVTIDDQEVRLSDRAEKLTELLATWVGKNICKHLTGKKKSIDLAHGTLGLRQKPLVAIIDQAESKASVLDKIDAATGLVTSLNAILAKKVTLVEGEKATATGADLLDLTIAPACKAMKDAFEAKRLTSDSLAELGITLREAFDEPVLTPTKIIVTSAE